MMGSDDKAATASSLPVQAGTYALLLRVPGRQQLRIGGLGTRDLVAGWYVYAGSARGHGGIRARVSRHLCHDKKRRWHIDYVRVVAGVRDVRWTLDRRLTEHDVIASVLSLPGAIIPVVGFGSSDCRSGCRAHLVRLSKKPDLRDILG